MSRIKTLRIRSPGPFQISDSRFPISNLLKNGYPQPTELRWRHMNSVFRRCEWVFSQTYLLGRVVKYAQRTQEILFHLRKKRLDSLRRAESVSGILQEFANSSLPASFGSLARLRLPGLSSRRPVSGSRV